VHIVSSFIFSPGTARFGVHLPPNVRETWLQPAVVARDEFRQTWNDAKADTILKNGLIWSLVYGATVAKVQHNPYSQFQLGYVNPGDFGVGREDVADLSEQDHVCHWYSLSMAQIERWLGHEPGNEALIAKCEAHKRPGPSRPAKARLVVSGVANAYPNTTVTAGFRRTGDGNGPGGAG